MANTSQPVNSGIQNPTQTPAPVPSPTETKTGQDVFQELLRNYIAAQEPTVPGVIGEAAEGAVISPEAIGFLDAVGSPEAANSKIISGIATAAKAFGEGYDRTKKGSAPSAEDIAAATEMQKLQNANAPDTKEIRSDTLKLKKAFDAQSSSFIQARDGWNKVAIAAKNPSAASDVSMIFGFMKTIDPGSVVREGEFATAANSAGVPERIRAQYNRILTGERLSLKQRKDFEKSAYLAFNEQRKGFNLIKNSYKTLLGEYEGVNPEAVITDYDAASSEFTDTSTGNEKEDAINLANETLADPNATADEIVEAKKILERSKAK